MAVEAGIAMGALLEFASECLSRTGLAADAAATAARTLVGTDGCGVYTHGTKLLAGYLKKLQGGGYRAGAVPFVEREGPAWAVINGDSGLGQLGCTQAVDLAIQKARQAGVAWVAICNTGHIGAAGQYALRAAESGCAAFVTGNDIPSVAAPGSRGAVLGSNPLAFAIPTDTDPIFLDIATAAVAGGKVYAALQRGEPIPPTWLIGPDGHPTTDGSLYPHSAALAPMAGHKGYGLGLWCEVLSAVLPGGRMTWDVGSWIFDPPERPSWHNASFTVYDVQTITDAAGWHERIGRLRQQLQNATPAEGCRGVLLPGQREMENLRRARVHGIPLPEDVRTKLREAGELCGVGIPSDLQAVRRMD
ncbi:MAG: Ldh family oxidoreductase [Planctomycetota bacterium]